MSEGKKPTDVPNINQLRQMAATAGRKSTVASTPKDPQQETYMGQSIGAKPGEPAAATSGAGEAPSMVNVATPRRRRERAARAPLDIDPSELAKFNLAGAAPPTEKPVSVSGLMTSSPEPEEEVKKSPSPLKPEPEKPEKKSPEPPKPKEEEEKAPSPVKPSESPKAAEKPVAVEPPKSAVPSPKPVQKPIAEASPKPAVVAAAVTPEKAKSPAAAPSAIDQKKLADLEVYEKICQKLVPGRDPSPMVLIGFIEPMKQQLPNLHDQIQKLQSQVDELSISSKKKDSQITNLQEQVVEAEKKATSAISEGTSKALEGVAINDEDVNKLRGAFEEHMRNYQSSLDQFQEFFDKITTDLDSTFRELGIEEKDVVKPGDKGPS